MSKLRKFDVLELIELAPAAVSGFSRERDMSVKMICLLIAMGEPADKISEKLGIDSAFVQSIITSPQGIEQTLKIQTAICPDPAQRVKKMANSALDVKYKLMMSSESDVVRNSAATDILDRAGGKPAQVIENRNFNMDATDMGALDRAIAAQAEKLAALETIERRLQLVQPVELPAEKAG